MGTTMTGKQMNDIVEERDRLRAELDAAKAETERQCKLRTDYLRAQLDIHKKELSESKANEARLTKENTTLRNAQKACEDCDAPTLAETNRLRAENARLAAALKKHRRFTELVAHHSALRSSGSQAEAHDALKESDSTALRDLLGPVERTILGLLCALKVARKELLNDWAPMLNEGVTTSVSEGAKAIVRDMDAIISGAEQELARLRAAIGK